MDHIRISGNETSLVILRQTEWFSKVENVDPKVPKQAEGKRDGVITNQISTKNNDALKTLRINRSRP